MSIITVTLNTAIDRVIEVPGLAIGGHIQGRPLRRYPAGKGINVSRALARLGRASVATGFVGRGEQEWFAHALAGDGPGTVTTQLIQVDGVTRENLTLVDPETARDLHVRTPGYSVDHNALAALSQRLGELAGPDSVMAFCGSLPREMAAEDLVHLLAAAGERNASIAVDLDGQVLARLFGSASFTGPCASNSGAGAPGTARPWLAKPNRRELLDWIGPPRHADVDGSAVPTADEALAAAAEALAGQIPWLAVSLGGQGAWLLAEGEFWAGRIDLDDQEKVANTVGCGDCMVAGLLDARARGLGVGPTLAHALACATANALSPGVAEFDARTVAALAGRARIRQVQRKVGRE